MPYKMINVNISDNRIREIAVFFEGRMAVITDSAMMQNGLVKQLDEMTDDETIDMLQAATVIGDELKNQGYVVKR